MRIHTTGSWAVALVCTVLLASAGAAPTDHCPARPIKLAHFDYGFFYRDGKGLEVDLLDEMRRRSGCAFAAEVDPRARIWIELEAGHIDMTMTVIQSPERDSYGWFVPYLQQRNFVLAGEGLPRTIASQADFLRSPTLRFGTVRGFRHGASYDDFIAELAKQGRLDTVSSSPQLFEMLRKGRVSAILASPLDYRFELKGEPEVRVMDWAPGGEEIVAGLLLSRAKFSEADAEYWRKLMDSITRDGTMLRLLEHYLPPDEAREALFH